MSEKSRSRGGLRRGLRRFFVFLASLAGLLLLTYLSLDTDFVRRRVRLEVLGLVDELLVGEIRARQLHTLRADLVEFRDVELLDDEGRVLARIDRLSAVPEWDELLSGVIGIADVHATGVWADMGIDEEGNLPLVEAVLPVDFYEPSPPPAEDEEPLVIVIHSLRVEEGVVEIPLGEGPPLVISEFAVEGELRVDDEFFGSVREGSALATLGETELAAIGELRGDYTTAPGGRSTASLELVGGDDHLIAEATLIEPPGTESGETELEGTLTLSPLTSRLLRAFDQAELADATVDSVEGEVRVGGPFDALHFEADLELAEGEASIELDPRDEGWEGRLCVTDVHLDQLHVSLPGSLLSGCTDVFYGDREEEGRRVRVSLEEGVVDGRPLPTLVASAMLRDDSLRLDHVEFRSPEDPERRPLRVEGDLGFDGSVDVHVRTQGLSPSREVILAELAPGFDGFVDSDLHVRVSQREHGPPDLAIRGRVVARRVRGPGFAFDRATLRAHTAGTGRSQRLGLEGRLHGLQIEDFRLEDARVRIEGGPTLYTIVLDTTLENGVDVHLELDVERQSGKWNVRGAGELMRGERDWQLGLGQLVASESGAVEVQGLRIARRSSAIEVDGLFGDRGELGLDAALLNVSFAELAYLLTGDDLDIEGQVDGRLRARGRSDRPEVEGELRLDDVGGYGVHDLGGSIAVDWGQDDAHVRAHFEAGAGGNITLEAGASWPEPGPPQRVIRESTLEGELHVAEFDMRFVDRLIEEELGLSGILDGRVELSGTYEEPVVAAKIVGESFTYLTYPTVRVELDAGLEGGALAIEGKIDDALGRLFFMRGSTPLGPWLEEGEIDPTSIPWQLLATLPERPLSTIEPAAEYVGSSELLYSAALRVASRPDARDLELAARARLRGNAHSGALADESCQDRPPVDLRFSAGYEDGVVAIETHFALATREVMAGRVNILADLPEWIREGLPETPPETSLELELAALDFGKLPVTCLYTSGPMSGHLQGRHLFSTNAELALRIRGDEVRLGDAPPTRIEVGARVLPDRIRLQLRDTQPEGFATLSASLPWSGLADENPAPLDQREISIQTHFESYSLEPLAAVTIFTAGHAGRIEGDLSLEGILANPQMNGELRLVESSFFVPGADQRLSNVTGALRAEGNTLSLVDLVAHDRLGWLEIDGRTEWEALRPVEVEVAITSHAFPVRGSGLILSYLTGETNFEGHRIEGGSAWEADLTLRDLTVRIPDDTDFAVQELEQHAEVEYVASLADVPADPAASVAVPQAGPHIEVREGEVRDDAVALTLRMRTENPFWVRRTDFAVQLMAELEAKVDPAGFELEGEVRTERGFMEMLGKSFDVRPGTIAFTGGHELDAALDLYATHDLASSPGDRLGVRIRGYASAPTVTFFDPDEEEITAGEALAWITTGSGSGFNDEFDSGSDATAAQQAQSVVAGLTAGILTTAARHGMGDRVPTLSVNTGAMASDVQVRAGFQANELIPEFMEGFITAMFVTGFVGTETEESDNGRSVQATGGMGIQLHHPRSLITSAEYQPPANWSMEIVWSP